MLLRDLSFVLLSSFLLTGVALSQGVQIGEGLRKELGEPQKALINDTTATGKNPNAESPSDARLAKFQTMLSGSKLTGLFTIEGKPLKDQHEETYEIRKVERPQGDPAAHGDRWIITARVKYGKNDYELPFPIDVKWAGDTPVLTLDNLSVPGMGVFSARVVLHGNKYAGTWQHDNISGHLFGKITFADTAPGASSSKPE